MHGVMGMGLLGLLGKLHRWDESAMFFDGSSLGAYPGSLFPPWIALVTKYSLYSRIRVCACSVHHSGYTIIKDCSGSCRRRRYACRPNRGPAYPVRWKYNNHRATWGCSCFAGNVRPFSVRRIYADRNLPVSLFPMEFLRPRLPAMVD